MKLRPTVASVINEHVTLELESIDRLYLNIFVPQLQREGGVAAFFRVHRGHPFASSALMDPISKEFVARLESFAKEQRVPVVQFRKGERKDDIAAEFIRKFKQEDCPGLLPTQGCGVITAITFLPCGSTKIRSLRLRPTRSPVPSSAASVPQLRSAPARVPRHSAQ